ncbi:mechanosensitive ion channel [uncultured Sphaerotilus sp.]|uniref:mechanosensitive ion channel n=1 Tax=uncultured Sphaerotilus sp. TaxID=474984 RepID=UPI0030CA33A1
MEQFSGVVGSVAAGLGPYAPKVIGALVMVLIAWIGSRLVRAAITRLCLKRQLDEKLQSPGFSVMLANVGVGVVWLFTLPGLLETLELKGLLDPVNVMMSRIMGFVPNLVGTIVVFGIGFLVARVVRQITTGMLRAAGSEKVAVRMGLSTSLGEGGLAGLVGSLVFSLIMLPVLAAALEPLGLDAVTQPVSNLLDTVIALIPKIAASAVIVAVAALIGRAVAGITTGVLSGMGFNKLSQHLGLGEMGRAGARTPSELAGSVVMFAIVSVAVMQACEVLGFAILTKLVVNLGAVLAGVAVAGVVMIGGLWLSNWVAGLIRAGSAVNAPALANLVRGAILFFTAALALRQAGLPGDIVGIAFGSVVGAIAVGAAVAVGVGGRHLAGRLLEEAVEALRTSPPASDTPPIQFPD